jgi:hypothetical protein
MDNREFEKFKQAVFGQESRNGAVPTGKPNYAGALGKGQILEETFEGLRKSGKIPTDYQWANPAHNEEAAVAYMQEAWQAGGQDPRKAAAYYYGGPKAIKGGEIVSYKDKLNPKAPDTIQYADQIANRMGLAGAPPPKQPTYDALKGAVQAANDSRRLDPDKFKANYVGLQVSTEGAIMRNSNEPGVLGMVGAALSGNTDQRIMRLFADEFPEEPGYKADFSKLPLGADRDLVEAYARTKSTLAADKVLREFDDENLRQDTLNRAGPVGAFALNLGGEFGAATNWLTGFAASAVMARTVLGSTRAFQAGNAGRGIVGNIAENVVSGTLVEAALSTAEHKFDLQSSGINLLADALISVPSSALSIRAYGRQAGQDLINQTRAATIAKETEYATLAGARLGPNATTDEVVAEIGKIKREEQLAIVPTNTARSDVFDIDRLVPEEAAPAGESTQALAAPTTVTKFADPANEARIGRGITSDTKFKEMADLGVFKHTDDFEERRMQVAMLKAEPGVHLGEAVASSGSYQRHAKIMEKLRAQFIPEVSIHLTDGGTGIGNATGVQGILKPNMSMVALRPGSNMRVMLHEFMHVVQAHRLSKASPEVQQAMVAEWEKWVPSTLKEGGAQEAMLRRSPLGATADMGVSNGQAGSAVYVDAVKGDWKGTLQSVFDNVFPDKVEEAEFKRYFTNFDEFSAEQGVKYLEARAMKIIGGPLKVPAEIIRMIAGFIREALEVFKFAKANNLLAPSEPFKRFLDDVLVGNKKSNLSPLKVSGLAPDIQKMQVPSIQEFDQRVSAGPAGRLRVTPIATGLPLYRETNVAALDDLLRYDDTAYPDRLFVADREELAIGQGDNTGVHLVFRPDSLSGKFNPKPLPSELTGAEYVTDLIAPRAVQQIEIDKKGLKSLRPLSMRVLRQQFEQTEASRGVVRFVRKQPTNVQAMAASELLEDASGVSGKKGSTAAIQKMQVPSSKFAEWFGDSKVVDAEGKPLVVYHGTNKSFANFKEDGEPIFLTQKTWRADGYSDQSGGNVMPVYANIRNPATMAQYEIARGQNKGPNARKKAVADLKAQGFDGVIDDITVMAFDPKQIKSAIGNNGNFDAASSDISKAAAPAVQPSTVVNEFLKDPDALKYGLTTLPLNTPAERKKAQAIRALHQVADKWAVNNPKDAAWDKRAKNWADNDVFNVASTGLIMLKSENNLVRMIASELLEDASGVSGKKGSTASITKYIMHNRIMGNAIPDMEEAYGIWSAGKKGSNLDGLVGGEYRKEFNRSVFELVERQGKGESINPDTPENAALLKAASVVQDMFKRSATEQIKANTLGSGALEDGVGYMPHKINPKMVMALTNEQTRVLHSALTDQFITIEGWDASFADMLASKYIERVQRRAHGDYSSSVGGNSADTADLVRETLMGMNLPEQIVADHMARFTKGAANFTKKRLDLDLHLVYDVDGKAFKLLDVFETDPVALMRSQAQRASGDIALASKGIKGKPGMQLMREAMSYGENGKKATDAEFGAFDQTAAEFFGDPFGTQSTRWMERAMGANTLIRLGGMGFNQLSETLNGVFHVGALRTFDSITSIPRLKAEIDALVRGEKVDNPIIGSIEAGGTEFGVDSHRVVLPYDSPDHAYPTYGKDTLTVTDRLLRGGGYLQAKLSGWRLIHSTQQRGMAEQVTRKVMRYIKEGKEDEALKGFGVNDNLRAALAADLDKIAVFDGNNKLTALDITKMTDPAVASELVQVIHRGVNQIIQGTFIGERGKWVHDGWLKLLTQFRSFSITSMEKQWGRQRNSHGVFAATGMLLGAMSMAAPIYMARVYAASIGREDQQEYLKARLTPQGIAKGTMNYVAMSGLFGDFADLLTAVAPDKVKDKLGITQTGTRAGTESEFIGTFLAPSAGLVDDAWKYLQSPDDLKEGAKLAPLGKLPYMIPLLNLIPKTERD